MVKQLAVVAVVALVAGVSANEVSAQDDISYGVRAGLAIDPDGFVIGPILNIPLADYDHFSIEPQALIGFGDFTTIEAGARVRFDIVDTDIDAQPYVAGGLAIHHISVDGTVETSIGDFDFGGASDTDIVLQIGAGLEKGPLGGEIVLGVSGRPDITVAGRYMVGGD